MAEKTTKKTTKSTAAKKSTAARKTTAVKTTTPTAVAAKPAVRKAVVRKRAAATVQVGVSAQQSVTGWRRFRRKTKVGVVVSAKQAKTVIVTIERFREHPLYKKVIRVRKRFAAHDEAGDVREGDLVRIQESRPYSATKRWRVVEVISRIGEAGAAAPRVADIEKALEEAEGAAEFLSTPEAEEQETEETGS
jgi:small subunit ribosomal protein S17